MDTPDETCTLHHRRLVRIDEATRICSWGSLGCQVKDAS